jgi:hypothetical protein
MSDTLDKAAWGVFGGSVRGSSHLRSGLPNQDSLGKWAGPGGSPAILAVSDGHGSASHFRSDVGSRMGADAAVQALRETPIPVPDGHSQVLAHSIVQAWREAVMAHLATNPFTEEEWAKLPPKEAAQAKAAILANPPIAYGATLLAVLAAESEILYLQLGDGDILCVDQHGGTTRPVPADSRLIANQTTSLCQKSAVEDFRAAHFQTAEGPPPALILVSSDGYSNSFQSDEDFLRVGPDYLELLRQYGPEKVEAQLQKILPEASRKGSGDDITLGFIQRMDGLGKPAPDPLPQPAAPAGDAAPQPAPQPARPVGKAAAQPTPAALEDAPQPSPPQAVNVQAGLPLAPDSWSWAPAAGHAAPRSGGEPAAPSAVSARSRTHDETTRLRRKLFWLKVALAGVSVLALTGAGLAWLHPEWLSWLRLHLRLKPAAGSHIVAVRIPQLAGLSYRLRHRVSWM